MCVDIFIFVLYSNVCVGKTLIISIFLMFVLSQEKGRCWREGSRLEDLPIHNMGYITKIPLCFIRKRNMNFERRQSNKVIFFLQNYFLSLLLIKAELTTIMNIIFVKSELGGEEMALY